MNWTIRPRRLVLLQVWLYLMCAVIATPLLAWIAVVFLTSNTTFLLVQIAGVLCVFLAMATCALGAWPLLYVFTARLIVTSDSVTKVYPFRVWHRTLLRGDVGPFDSYPMDLWTVIRFHDKRGKVVFKLGTNWWPPDKVRVLIDQLR